MESEERSATPLKMRPLNFADHFTLVMDHQIREAGQAGSIGGYAIELDQPPDMETLEQRVRELVQRFPTITSSLQKIGRRYAWVPRDRGSKIIHHHICPNRLDDQKFQRQTLEEIANCRHPREEAAPMEFHVISGAHTNLFFLSWIHPLCDARGADLIIKYLCTDDHEERQRFGDPGSDRLMESVLATTRWWQKIVMVFKAKRHMKQMDKLKSILPVDPGETPKQLRYRICRFDREQTAAIAKQAHKYVGMIGTTLYYIGCFMRAIERTGYARAGDAYCVPYAINLRKQKALSPLLGNHISVLFAQAEQSIVRNRDQLFGHLKQQNKHAIRNGIEFAFLPLMWAGTWLPLERYGRILRQTPHGTERNSFWFSDIGDPGLSDCRFLGSKIRDVFHLCQITSPPALALLVGLFDGRLTLTYNYLTPDVDESWLERLQLHMSQELLGEVE